MRKRLIIFCDYFGNGGIEKISTYIKKNIDKDKFSTEILCTIKNSQLYNDKVESISNKKYKNPIYRFIKTSFNIRRYTKNADIININIHSPIGLFYALLVKRKSNKVVVYAHNSSFDNDILKMKTIIASIFRCIFSSKKYRYIASSKETAKFCFKKGVKYEVVKSEIDRKRFIYNEEKRTETRKKYNISEDEIVIGNIGRLTKQKNQQFLIRVFAEFKRLRPNSKLFLIGTGNEQKNICKLIEQEKLTNDVIMLGKEKYIENMYQMFDCYVSTSKYEGYGLTIYEALISSLKCFVPTKVSHNFNDKNIVKMKLNDTPYKWANKINKELNYQRVTYDIEENNQYIKQMESIYME